MVIMKILHAAEPSMSKSASPNRGPVECVPKAEAKKILIF